MPQNAASDQGLCCLPLIQHYFRHTTGSKIVFSNFRTSMVRRYGVPILRVNTMRCITSKGFCGCEKKTIWTSQQSHNLIISLAIYYYILHKTIKQFCKQTAKALIRLHRCTSLSVPSLFTYLLTAYFTSFHSLFKLPTSYRIKLKTLTWLC